jgi:hypothetical protein
MASKSECIHVFAIQELFPTGNYKLQAPNLCLGKYFVCLFAFASHELRVFLIPRFLSVRPSAYRTKFSTPPERHANINQLALTILRQKGFKIVQMKDSTPIQGEIQQKNKNTLNFFFIILFVNHAANFNQIWYQSQRVKGIQNS